jgi:hypothetical protein
VQASLETHAKKAVSELKPLVHALSKECRGLIRQNYARIEAAAGGDGHRVRRKSATLELIHLIRTLRVEQQSIPGEST